MAIDSDSNRPENQRCETQQDTSAIWRFNRRKPNWHADPRWL